MKCQCRKMMRKKDLNLKFEIKSNGNFNKNFFLGKVMINMVYFSSAFIQLYSKIAQMLKYIGQHTTINHLTNNDFILNLCLR